ncbi:hypothetical protein AAVH_43783, partial [Aphelenchoides avenae]
MTLARRITTTGDEYEKIKEQLEYAPNKARNKQLSKLFRCKEIELVDALNDFVVAV